MKNIKRRFFIKSSSLIAGGLVLPSFKIERMANNVNNKKLKVSVIGCGGRGTGAAVQALRADDNVELIAMADAFEDRLENSLAAIKEEMDGEKTIDVKEKKMKKNKVMKKCTQFFLVICMFYVSTRRYFVVDLTFFRRYMDVKTTLCYLLG